MVLLLDLDRTLNCLRPAEIRSIRELAPSALVRAGGPPLWSWLTRHLSEVEYPINQDALAVVEELCERAPATVIVSTGRPEGTRAITADWLARYVRIDSLLMRGDDDFRPTVEVKKDNLCRYVLSHHSPKDIWAFEDNSSSVHMYREAGIRTFSTPEIWGKLRFAMQAGLDLIETLLADP